jgi:hypothetical protein
MSIIRAVACGRYLAQVSCLYNQGILSAASGAALRRVAADVRDRRFPVGSKNWTSAVFLTRAVCRRKLGICRCEHMPIPDANPWCVSMATLIEFQPMEAATFQPSVGETSAPRRARPSSTPHAFAQTPAALRGARPHPKVGPPGQHAAALQARWPAWPAWPAWAVACLGNCGMAPMAGLRASSLRDLIALHARLCRRELRAPAANAAVRQ